MTRNNASMVDSNWQQMFYNLAFIAALSGIDEPEGQSAA